MQGYGALSRGNSFCKIVEVRGSWAGAESARRGVVSRETRADPDGSYLEGVTVWERQGEE